MSGFKDIMQDKIESDFIEAMQGEGEEDEEIDTDIPGGDFTGAGDEDFGLIPNNIR